MNFNRHLDLVGQHAFLGGSKYHWVYYDEDKLSNAYYSFLTTKKGTELHEFACQCIRLGIKLPKTKTTLNMYVNDAIGFKMTPEQPLFYSYNAFGTADAISFRNDMLRVHDYKSGETPAHMEQLRIYAAWFCLEYQVKPTDILIELRIYQSDHVIVENPDPMEIQRIMDQTVLFDKGINKIKLEV